ncbi:pancreatic triacylglycerol lipase [Episyrphus balteatus]|uniref:pancreatic triacylglycerol lipase n=1 Tax=Episyrphus balteatus TaxID=286459 RepID=UPI002484F4AA|nr:pancreatic triacylglycerol lipase [Episyrphus balteatus]
MVFCIDFYWLIFLIGGSVFSQDIELTEENYGTDWIYMPNGDGVPEIAYLVEPPMPSRNTDSSKTVTFELYPSEEDKPIIGQFWVATETFIRRKRDSWTEMAKKFNPELETKILVHGWKSSSQSNSIQSIKNGYRRKGSYNIFAINWRDQADSIYYLEPARYTVQVGRAIAKLINLLVEEKDADPSRIHLLGHSLGAHIMGYAGSYSRHRVGRITGLDPARPAFENCIGPEHHLDRTDAEFVDVIHSCAGVLGYKEPIGFVDFYPNGGDPPQPGCGQLFQVITGCSHGRSYEYFAESINTEKGFFAKPCSTIDAIKNNNCTGDSILMGDRVPREARGIYYLKTNAMRDFALGDIWDI